MALSLTACEQDQERRGEAAPAEQSSEPPTQAPAEVRVERTISWPPAAELDREALAALPAAAATAIDRAPLPVLVVNRAELLARTQLIAKPKWYALSTSADGVTVSLHATRVAHRYPHIAPASGNRSVRGQSAFVTQNHHIWSVAWVERGAAYALEVECASLPDPRCDDERFVMELAAGLAYVGGREAAPPSGETTP